jgi:hypothetical protein
MSAVVANAYEKPGGSQCLLVASIYFSSASYVQRFVTDSKSTAISD